MEALNENFISAAHDACVKAGEMNTARKLRPHTQKNLKMCPGARL
jgi:hypothetical protein